MPRSRNRRTSTRNNSADLPLDFLKEALDYNPDTGALVWKERPLHHFLSENRQQSCNRRWAGRVAGQKVRGYRRIEIKYNRETYICMGHQLCWRLSGREYDPNKVIDHINGVTTDDRIDNLRLITQCQNSRNRTTHKKSKTGVSGVTLFKGRYRVQIKVNYKMLYIGSYETFEEAVRVRRNAELYYFGEFARSSQDNDGTPTVPKPRCPNCSSLTAPILSD
jgi:hypothetical protein